MESISTSADNSGAQRQWLFNFTPLPGGREGYHLQLVPPLGENTSCVIDFTTLLALLDYTDDEFVSISQKGGDGRFRTLVVTSPAEAVELVEQLADKQDVYFGINPTSGPARTGGRRGGNDAVTRLAVLVADLDISSGKCVDLATAHVIIDYLSAILGTRPSAVTDSGGGLHAYWPIVAGHIDGAEICTAQAAGVLRRWGKLVEAVAANHGAKADNVFDLARVLRVPGTVNSKYAADGQEPTVAICHADAGGGLTLDRLLTALDDLGITENGANTKTNLANGSGRIGSHRLEVFSRSQLVGRVRAAAEGRRNTILYGAAKDAARQGDLDEDMDGALTSAAQESGLPDAEIASTIRSAASSTQWEPPENLQRSSWEPIDLAAARRERGLLRPTFGHRDDGEALFYPGKVHWVYGETESGKTWLALVTTAECLTAKEPKPVLFIDFEDDGTEVSKRLVQLGVPESIVDDPKLFAYLNPDVALGTPSDREAFERLISRRFALAVIDGVTESMTLFGLAGKDNDDVATWQRVLPKTIARTTGAAVICIDHVTKDADSRGRFALGGQHKIAGLDGAGLIVDPAKPFAPGLVGEASVRVGKDRPGCIRAKAGGWRKTDRTQLAATFSLDSTDPVRSTWTLSAPADVGAVGKAGSTTGPASAALIPMRPRWCMQQVSHYWETTTDPAMRSSSKTESAMFEMHKGATLPPNNVKITRALWRRAINALVIEGYAKWVPGPRGSHLHTSTQPYRESTDPTPDHANMVNPASVSGAGT